MGKFKDIAIELMEEEEMTKFNNVVDLMTGDDLEFPDGTPTIHTPNELESAAHDVESILTTYDMYEIVDLLSADVKGDLFNTLLEFMDD